MKDEATERASALPAEPHGNGIKLKRTQHGYTWDLTVAAASGSIEDMMEALSVANTIDMKLVELYGAAVADRHGEAAPARKGRKSAWRRPAPNDSPF